MIIFKKVFTNIIINW